MPKGEPFSYDPNLKVWERQPGEPKQAHVYFSWGMTLRPGDRSMKKVWEKAKEESEKKVAGPDTFYNYSYQYDWDMRWSAFDAHTFAGWYANLANDRMVVAYELAEQNKLLLEITGQFLVALREERGALPPIEFIRSMNAALGAFKTIYGAAPETVHHTGPGGGPLVTLDFGELDQLTPAELAARVKQLTGQDLPPDLGGPADAGTG